MVNYSENDNALQMGDDDVLEIGDHELGYDSTEDEWVAEQQAPTGGPNGFHGENQGATYTTNNQFGDFALNFDGSSSQVFFQSDDGLSSESFSVSVWINVDRFKDTSQDILSRWYFGDGSRQLWRVAVYGDKTVEFHFRDTNDVQNTVSTILSGSGWTHVVGVRDSSSAELYVDDSSVDTLSLSNPPRTNVDTPLLFGNRPNSPGNADHNYDGKIDDVRLYSKRLSAPEVNTLFTGGDVTDSQLARYSFEYPETDTVIDVTGDPYPRKNVPRSAGGSAVPTGLANAVSNGEVLSDNGQIYSSIQTAVDNASGWVFVGPGTFNEAVTVSTAGMTIEGSGYGTLIDGGTTGNAITVNSGNVTISHLSLQTTAGGGNANECITTGASGTSLTVNGVTVRDSDQDGIRFTNGTDHIARNCVIESADRVGINSDARDRIIITGCVVSSGVSDTGIRIADGGDIILSNNIIDGVTDGIYLDDPQADSIVIGNRISNSGDDGITLGAGSPPDNIIANNRVSDSAANDIEDNGTNTTLDANLTGASN